MLAWASDATKVQDDAVATARREIELLREYRTRLVADVVTGQLDVREAAGRLPDLPPEADAAAADLAEDDLDDEADADAPSTKTSPHDDRYERARPGGDHRRVPDRANGRGDSCRQSRRRCASRLRRAPEPASACMTTSSAIRATTTATTPSTLSSSRPSCAATQPGARRALWRSARRPDAPQVPRPASGRDHQARRHRRPAQRHQARAAPRRPVLRHALARQRRSRASCYAREPLLASPASSATAATRRSARSTSALFINGLPVATFELKNSLTKQTVEDAVEQYKRDRDPREKLFEFGRCVAHFAVDDHEVRFCTAAARARHRGSCRSTRAGTTAPATRRTPTASRPTTSGSEILTPPGSTDILENYAQIVEQQGPEDGQEEARADLPALPPARRRAEAARRRAATRCRPALPDPALGRQRQVELDRLARPPARSACAARRRDVVRLDHRRHRPAHPRPADPRHDQAVRPGRRDGRPRRALRRPARVHRERQEDHHHDGPEVPVHPRRDRRRAPRPPLRDHHRRGAFEPGRQDRRRAEPGALRRPARPRRTRRPRTRSTASMESREAAAERELLRLHGDAEEQDAGDLRRACPEREGKVKHRPVPQLHDEAGDPGRLHPRRARELHAGRQLLPAGQDGRGRSRSSTPSGRGRSCAATSRATTTRSGSRPRSWSTTSTSRCSP